MYELVQKRGTCFDTDDGNQVMAARHWLSDDEYAIRKPVPDLAAEPVYEPVTRWPAGYSALVMVVLKTGMPLMPAVLLLRVLLLIAAVAGWFLIGRRIMRSEMTAAVLVVLVTFRLSMNPPDLFVCAVAPFLIIVLLEFRDSREIFRKTLLLITICLLVAGMVVVKYSALYFIPGVFLVVAFDSVRKRSLKKPVLLVLALSLVGAIVFFGTSFMDSEDDSQIWKIEVEEITVERLPKILGLPFTTIMLEPFKINSVVRRLSPILASSSSTETRLWKTIISIVLVVLMILLLLSYGRMIQSGEISERVTSVAAVLALCAGAFFVVVDVLLSEVGYASVYRYYAPVAPILIFVFARLAGELLLRPDWISRTMGAGTAILFGPLLVYVSQDALRIVRSDDLRFNQGMEFIANTTSDLRGNEPAVYQGHIRTFCQINLPLVNLETDDEEFWDEATTATPVWLFLLDNRRSSSPRYSESIERLSVEFGLHTEAQDDWEVHYRRLEPGFVRQTDAQTPDSRPQ